MKLDTQRTIYNAVKLFAIPVLFALLTSVVVTAVTGSENYAESSQTTLSR